VRVSESRLGAGVRVQEAESERHPKDTAKALERLQNDARARLAQGAPAGRLIVKPGQDW
jgi:hypothetical protein